MLIRRPCVWLCTIVILLYLSIYALRGEEIEKNLYPCDSLLQDGPVPASVRGTFYRAETTDASHRIYLQQVTLNVDGENSFFFSHFLVYLDELPHIYPGNELQINGTLSELQQASNPGQFDTKAYYREQRIYYQLFGKETRILSDDQNPVYTALWKLQNDLSDAIDRGLPPKQAGVLKSVVLGQKNEMGQDIKNLYRQNGIGHLLAISGLHITILCMGFYRFLLFCRLPRCVAIPLTMILLYLYGAMTGFGIATSRAVIMMILFLLAQLIQKSYDLLSSLAVSALIIVIRNPFALSSCSFLFSYMAVLGMALFFPVLQSCIYGSEEERRAKRRQKRKRQQGVRAVSPLWQLYDLQVHMKERIWDSFLASIAIQLTTLPVILYFYYEVPVYGIFLNLLVLPFVSLLIVLGSVAGFTGLFCLPLSRFLFGGVWGILNFYEGLCRMVDKLPLHTVILGKPSLWHIGGYYGILFVTLLSHMNLSKESLKPENGFQKASHMMNAKIMRTLFPVCTKNIRRKSDMLKDEISVQPAKTTFSICTKTLIIWSLAVCFLLLPSPHPYFSVTFLDVGQGDGVFLQSPAGTTFLIDGGSTSEQQVGKYRLIPFLKSQGISHLDYMIMTHADEDHISGQLELLAQAGDSGGISVGCLLLPKPAEILRQESGYQNMIRAAVKAHVPIQTIYTGVVIQEGKLIVRCLHPPKEYETDSANAYSTTIRVEYGTASLLLCGDLEGDGEELVAELLRQNFTSFDILKVAHHGSKNSTDETFLELVNPALAIISCGKNNRYGHPHKELMERLENAGVAVMQTAQKGSITIRCDGEKYDIYSYFD